jgi:hypothetical protein
LIHAFPPSFRRAAALLVAGAVLLPAASLPPAAAAPPADSEAAAKAIRAHFRGKVVSLKGRRVEIAYDFADPEQAKDWAPSYPFQKPQGSGGWRITAAALRGDGNAGFRHRAVFDGDVRLTATLSCEDAKDFGAVVLDEDKTQFDIFALADSVFGGMDRQPPGMHMVATFQPAGSGPGGSTEWRYVERKWEPKLGTEPFELSVRKRGTLNEFRFGAAGKIGGNDKECHVGPRMSPAFYTLGSRVVVTKAAVAGVLDPAWLRSQGIPVESDSPEEAEAPAEGPPKDGGSGAGPGAAPGDPKPAAVDWNDLVRKVADPNLPRDAREKAADALAESKERRALRPMIDLLYSDSDPTGREMAIRVFKGISGKEVGFKADASHETRVKFMPRLWDIWYQAKDALDREEREKKAKEK